MKHSDIAAAGRQQPHRRILFVSHREQNFEGCIILLKKRTQIRFQIEIESGKRFQNADGLG